MPSSRLPAILPSCRPEEPLITAQISHPICDNSSHDDSNHDDSIRGDSIRDDSIRDDATQESSNHGDSIHDDFNHGDFSHDDSIRDLEPVPSSGLGASHDSIHDDFTHGDSCHNDFIRDDSLRDGSIRDDSTREGSRHDDSIGDDFSHDDSCHDDFIRDDSLHDDSICDDSTREDSSCDDYIHDDLFRGDSICGGSIHGNSIPTEDGRPPNPEEAMDVRPLEEVKSVDSIERLSNHEKSLGKNGQPSHCDEFAYLEDKPGQKRIVRDSTLKAMTDPNAQNHEAVLFNPAAPSIILTNLILSLLSILLLASTGAVQWCKMASHWAPSQPAWIMGSCFSKNSVGTEPLIQVSLSWFGNKIRRDHILGNVLEAQLIGGLNSGTNMRDKNGVGFKESDMETSLARVEATVRKNGPPRLLKPLQNIDIWKETNANMLFQNNGSMDQISTPSEAMASWVTHHRDSGRSALRQRITKNLLNMKSSLNGLDVPSRKSMPEGLQYLGKLNSSLVIREQTEVWVHLNVKLGSSEQEGCENALCPPEKPAKQNMELGSSEQEGCRSTLCPPEEPVKQRPPRKPARWARQMAPPRDPIATSCGLWRI